MPQIQNQHVRVRSIIVTVPIYANSTALPLALVHLVTEQTDSLLST